MSSNTTYRPADFSGVVGNQTTIESLESLLASKDPAHAIMFFGPAGCGKTTLARIVSSKLGCSDFDFKEINVSDNRGIDTARDIINTSFLRPMAGKVKVYLLDEVHKATPEFQNAMLKILEEPPAHVFFILCTTEPEKIIATVRSRCIQYSVNPLGAKKIKRLVSDIAEKEGVKISDSTLAMIGDECGGSPRSALLMYDKIKGLPENKQIEMIEEVKKTQNSLFELCKALLDGKEWKIVSTIIQGIEDEPEKVRRSVLGYMGKVLLNPKPNIRAAAIIECFQDNYYDTGRTGLIFSCFQACN